AAAGSRDRDRELRELASLAGKLAGLGHGVVRAADTAASWNELRPLLLATPQRRRVRPWSRWSRLMGGWHLGAFLPTPRMASLAVGVLSLVIAGSAVSLLPARDGSAAFVNDIQRLSLSTAAATGRGTLAAAERVLL